MADFVTSMRPEPAVAPAVRTATQVGATKDRRGFGSVVFLVYTGPGGITFTGTNRLDWTVQHSDDGTGWSDVETGDVLGANGRLVTITSNGRVESYTSAKAAESVTAYEYVGPRRYVRINATFNGTHGTGTMTGAVAAFGSPTYRPAA